MKILAYGAEDTDRLSFGLQLLDHLGGGVLIDNLDVSPCEGLPKPEAQALLAEKAKSHRSLASGMIYSPIVAIDHYLDIQIMDGAAQELIDCWWPMDDYDWVFFLGDTHGADVLAYADSAAEAIMAYGGV